MSSSDSSSSSPRSVDSDSETSDSSDPLSNSVARPPPSKKPKIQQTKPNQQQTAKPSARQQLANSNSVCGPNFNFPYLNSPPSSSPLADSGRSFTVSIALPGSIISNVQSGELRSYIAGQIARSCSIFNIDEIVIFNENPGVSINKKRDLSGDFRGPERLEPNEADVFLGRILQYLETPQYLRKLLFPVHPALKFAGLLNPLDLPSHLRQNENFKFREGVVVKRPTANNRHNNKKKEKKETEGEDGDAAETPTAGSSWVNCGLLNEVLIDRSLPYGTRVTVEILNLDKPGQRLNGRVV